MSDALKDFESLLNGFIETTKVGPREEVTLAVFHASVVYNKLNEKHRKNFLNAIRDTCKLTEKKS